MPIPKVARRARPTQRSPYFLILLLVVLFVASGCGAPGEPLPPSPPIPTAISDLTAQQAGDAVLLTFTMPKKSVRGESLKEVPTLEVLRGSLKADGTTDAKSFRVVDTVPGSLLGNYVQQGKVEFHDPISADEIKGHAGEAVVYRVRTRVSDKKTSADSKEVSLRLYAVPARIASLDVRVTEGGIQLKWATPEKTSGGDTLGQIQEFHVYRGELDEASAAAAAKDLSQAVWKSRPLQLAATTTPEFLDTGFDYGKTYAYLVRSVVLADGAQCESGDSSAVFVTPQDTFPPGTPQGIVAAVIPGSAAGSLVVDLSWSLNVEADLAGYRLYRSEQEGTAGQLLSPDLLPTPAYRDNSVSSGKRYWYMVTAVDRAGNESASSTAVAVDVTQPSP
ncbi:MAG: fibronectin type III domain-containing protein [Candidatus Acidiferrales bacterium]